MNKYWLLLLLVAGGRVAVAAEADLDCEHASDECVATKHWNFSLAFGAGVRSNPLTSGKDIPLVIVPQLSYYGRRFFIDNLDAGFSLAEGSLGNLSLLATPGYDRVYFYRSDLQNLFINGFSSGANATVAAAAVVPRSAPGAVPYPEHTRSVTYLAGPEWTAKIHGVTAQVDLLHEVTGHNHGDEIRAAFGIPLYESVGSLHANVGLTWKSAAVVNYYYGEMYIYQGGAAFNPFVKLGYTRPLGGKWRLNALLHFEKLGKSIRDSPIVEADNVETVFVGAVYAF